MMSDEINLGPGFPEWTELGQDTGLDPLGMQRPIELVYQSLLPGISTITLRLRYYSFFAWLLETYANRVGVTNDYEAFRQFQRRAEALYALICARGELELGVAGIDWARDELAKIVPTPTSVSIDFSRGASPDPNVTVRYLRNRGGAFGGIYASQMREMGLVKLDDTDLPIPFCMDAALPLAEGFRRSLGSSADAFLGGIEAGAVTLATLDQLQTIRPSKIEPKSPEQQELAAILMARHVGASQSDRTRSETLRMLLRLAHRTGRPPKSEEAKWAWFGASCGVNGLAERSDLRSVWALYQTSDLLRLAYETMLTVGLDILNNAPRRSQSITDVVGTLIDLADLPEDHHLSDWLLEQASGSASEDLAKAAAISMQESVSTGDQASAVHSAWKLIAALLKKGRSFDAKAMEWLGHARHFQSLVSEAGFVEERSDLPVKTALAEILRDRIFRRHIWVASRKFRNQKAYTFLFEPDEGRLRFRSFFRLSPSSPRIDQAVQFLRDVQFIDDGGVTDLGLAELKNE